MKACPKCGVDIEAWGKLHICRPRPAKKFPVKAIPAVLEDVADHQAMKAKLRKDVREGKVLPKTKEKPVKPEDGVALGFDRVRYQREYMREYMRRYRAKRRVDKQ